MSDQPDPDLFGVHLPVWPDWFTAGSQAPAIHCRRVAMGRHPFGLDLGPPESTCGSCTHIERHGTRARNTFLKCALAKQTRGPATDLRAKWRGCVKWAPKP